jgi:hypothetical protein
MELVKKIVEFAAPVLLASFWILVFFVVIFKARGTRLAAKFIEYMANTDSGAEVRQRARLHHAS